MPTDSAARPAWREVTGICWPHQATVGHIAVASGQIAGCFAAECGSDALVDCLLVAAGKYRNGAARQWCRTHQTYWGVKADLAALAASGRQRCAHYLEPMGYALHPPVIDLAAHASVTIGNSPDGTITLATALPGASEPVTVRCAALALRSGAGTGATDPLFFGTGTGTGTGIVQVNITPPALLAYTTARAAGRELGCVCCARCGYPHLDLGSFAQTPHRRHYCGNCGCDSTHSPAAMISSPLHALGIKFGGVLTIQ